MLIFKAKPTDIAFSTWEADTDNIRCSCDDFDYSGEHMGQRKIVATIKSANPITFEIGDYFLFDTPYDNERMFLQKTPVANRVWSSPMISYTCTFWWVGYDLQVTSFLDAVEDEPGEFYYSSNSDVQLYVTAEGLLRRIIYNLDRAGYAGWSYQISPDADLNLLTVLKDLTLTNQYCWDALALVKSEFALDWRIQSEIRCIQVGFTPVAVEAGGGPFIFEHGKDKGLCEINRLDADHKIITRVYGYGSTRNIPDNYRTGANHQYHPRLMLPNEQGYIQDDALVAKYGVREDIFIDESIYPKLDIPDIYDPKIIVADEVYDGESSTTAHTEYVVIKEAYTEWITVSDTVRIPVFHYPEVKAVEIPAFDNTQFVVYITDPGFSLNDTAVRTTEEARMAFTGGPLYGQDFRIIAYEKKMEMVGGVATWVDSLYKVTLERNTDNNYTLPNHTIKAQAGDTFTFLGINLPQQYVTNAENRLLTATHAYLEAHKNPFEGYSISIPEEFVARMEGVEAYLRESNAVMFRDLLLGVTDPTAVLIQNISISYKSEKLLPTYNLTISDTPIKGYMQKIEARLKAASAQSEKGQAQIIQQQQQILKSATMISRSIINNNGDIIGSRLEPSSVLPSALSEDLRSTRYVLTAYFRVNYDGNANAVYGSTGSIIHNDTDFHWGDVYDLTHRTWEIQSSLSVTLVPENYYYIYVKASRETGTAEWVVSTDKLPCITSDPYYFFEWGVVLPVRDGIRYVQGEHGEQGISSYVYIAYASDDTGTGFTLTADANLQWMAILSSPSEIETPTVDMFEGLWWNRLGEGGGGASFPATITSTTTNSDNGVTHTHQLGSIPFESVVNGGPVEYGALYNWHAVVDIRNIANIGFNVPSFNDITTLSNYLGGNSVSGGRLKETGTTYWNSPNTGATNDVGFNARGSGYRDSDPDYGFDLMKETLGLWTVTTFNEWFIAENGFSPEDESMAMAFTLGYYTDHITGNGSYRNYGYSVRLFRSASDSEQLLPDGLISDFYTGNDGKVYPLTKIGNQIWIACNLSETKYRDGSLISVVTDNTAWSNLSTEAMCYYGNNTANGGGQSPLTIITEHGQLTGLDADDHTQYHTDARGDDRYLQKANNLSDLASASTARTNLGLKSMALYDAYPCTLAQYNAIATKDPNTIYLVEE